VLRGRECFEGLTNWRLDCSDQVEELLGRDNQMVQFMYTIRDCVACVVLGFTLRTLLFGLLALVFIVGGGRGDYGTAWREYLGSCGIRFDD